MRWDARGTIALLVSALVGVTAGVVVGLTNGSPGEERAEDPGPSAGATGSPSDPLDLGIPLENVGCIGEKILVVGWGDTTGRLAAAAADNSEAKYLETARSCNTLYGPEGQPTPKYVVYLGPFDSTSEPCMLRMSVDHTDDAVTSLKPGQQTHVPCLCVLRPADMPTLSIGMHPSTREGIYIRALQKMLLEIGLLTVSQVTGHYGPDTARVIERLQKLNALNPDKYGIVEPATWRQVIDRGCVSFDF